MKRIFFLIIINFIFITTNSMALTEQEVSTSTYNVLSGQETSVTAADGGLTLTVKDTEIKLASLSSSFSCENPTLSIDGEIIEDMGKMFSQLGSTLTESVKTMISEMATQAGVELSLEMLARLHYMVTNDTMGSASVLMALKGTAVATCVSDQVVSAFESEEETCKGIGMYDCLAAKIGTNFTALAGIVPCVKKILDEPKDKSAKERLDKSRKWVRHFFYKILNGSFNDMLNFMMTAGELDPKCKELRTQIKKGNIGTILGQFGEVISPTGSTVQAIVEVMDPITVGKHVVEIKIDEPRIPEGATSGEKDAAQQVAENMTKAEAAEVKVIEDMTMDQINEYETRYNSIENNVTLTETEKNNATSILAQTMQTEASTDPNKSSMSQIKAATMKQQMKNNSIKEVPITYKIIVNPNYDIIDLTDLKEGEVQLFNKMFYQDIVKKIGRRNTNYSREIEGTFLHILEKIFTVSKVNNVMINRRNKEFEAFLYNNDNEITSYPKWTKTIPQSKVLNEFSYYSELYNKAKMYSYYRNGVLIPDQENRRDKDILLLTPKNQAKNPMIKIKNAAEQLKNIEKYKNISKTIAGGEPIFYTGALSSTSVATKILDDNKIRALVYEEYQKDLNELTIPRGRASMNYPEKVNSNVIKYTSLHELEFLKLLYTLESRAALQNFMALKPGAKTNDYIISLKTTDFTKNNHKKELVDYAIKNIKLIKELYAIEILDMYSKRSKAIQAWVMSSRQQYKNKSPEEMMSIKETEVEKFYLKQKQKRLMVKLLLEKEVEW